MGFWKSTGIPWKRGDWVAQLVKDPTPDFGSGHDLRVMIWSPCKAWNLLKILFPFPSAAPLSLSLSLSNKTEPWKNKKEVQGQKFWGLNI